jgi:tetratricopeptide (TPR) repeat protein
MASPLAFHSSLALDTRARRLSLLIAVVCIAGGIGFLVATRWRAEHLARSAGPAEWLRAAELEPGNAAHWQRLGRYRQFDFENADVALAVSSFERASRLDPGNPHYWRELAAAYEVAGEPSAALAAFDRARASHPVSALVAWHFGNFLIRRGDLDPGFAEIRRAVLGEKSLLYPAVSVCWRAAGDADRLLDEVLPSTGEAYAAAMSFFLVQQETQAAFLVWRRWVTAKSDFNLRPALSLLDQLLRDLRWTDAADVWRKSLEAAALTVPPLEPGSLVTDGGFARDFVNGGFGWRRQSVTGALIGFDEGAAGRSLRVEFDGTANLDFAHVSQWVLVEPGVRYRFRARLRTKDISTDTGLQFLILSRHTSDPLLVYTSPLLGTLNWTSQEVEFTAGRSTHVVEIILRRAPSRKFDNKIKGTVWVDDVSLVRTSPPAESAR